MLLEKVFEMPAACFLLGFAWELSDNTSLHTADVFSFLFTAKSLVRLTLPGRLLSAFGLSDTSLRPPTAHSDPRDIVTIFKTLPPARYGSDAMSFFRALLRRGPRTIKPKPIQPRDPQKPSFANLNHEILDLVVEHLDPQSINALALVCSALYAKARYVQLRHVLLDFYRGANRASQRVRFLSQKNTPLSAIRTLHVQPSKTLEHSLAKLTAGSKRSQNDLRADLRAELASWNQLSDLVPRMPGLRDLYWGTAVIPDLVLNFLYNNPQVRLHLSIDIKFFPGYTDKAAATVKAFPARLAGT